MTHEQFWSWVYVIGTAGLGWPPDTVMHTNFSDILLAWEGKAAMARMGREDDDAPALTAETFMQMAEAARI
jgi:hypothetical protein